MGSPPAPAASDRNVAPADVGGPHREPRSLPSAFLPPRPLAREVRVCFAADGIAVPTRLLPDGCVDLVFNLDRVAGQPDAAVIGVTAKPRYLSPTQRARRFGVSFTCGEAGRFLGAPMHLFVDRIVDLRDVLG